ncbi:VanZ family protein [Candidatus Poribacteria bacterium]|nr:VanZ family protein [Candidatus Poribacteria bacterium]
MIFIFYLSSCSSLPGPDFIPHFDKIEHLIAYLILSLLFYRAWSGSQKFSQKNCIILAVLCTILFGLSDEFHQSFVPNRCADIYDLIFDSIGAILPYYWIDNLTRMRIFNKIFKGHRP